MSTQTVKTYDCNCGVSQWPNVNMKYVEPITMNNDITFINIKDMYVVNMSTYIIDQIDWYNITNVKYVKFHEYATTMINEYSRHIDEIIVKPLNEYWTTIDSLYCNPKITDVYYV